MSFKVTNTQVNSENVRAAMGGSSVSTTSKLVGKVSFVSTLANTLYFPIMLDATTQCSIPAGCSSISLINITSNGQSISSGSGAQSGSNTVANFAIAASPTQSSIPLLALPNAVGVDRGSTNSSTQTNQAINIILNTLYVPTSSVAYLYLNVGPFPGLTDANGGGTLTITFIIEN